MRIYWAVIAALVVAGCAPEVPDSSAGVGFDNYQNYQQARDAELAGPGRIVLGAEISDEVVASGADVPTAAATPVAVPAPVVEPVSEPASEPVQSNTNTSGISDEQDFEAVSGRETIESDAARRAAQQEAYQVIAPTALPTRQRGSGAVVVEFALSTTNLVGQSIYRRSSLSGSNRYRRNCAKYPSPDLAQQAFLKNGGPERDRQGIDPDGDGFACFWDPTPFRQAVRN